MTAAEFEQHAAFGILGPAANVTLDGNGEPQYETKF